MWSMFIIICNLETYDGPAHGIDMCQFHTVSRYETKQDCLDDQDRMDRISVAGWKSINGGWPFKKTLSCKKDEVA